jgi:hypothetical protein
MSHRGENQLEHDQVIMASALTYERWKEKGYLVSTNPDGHQNHNIGNGIFPDLVVWKPDGEFGQTVIIEEVETADTINDRKAKEWKKLQRWHASFFLIVPRECVILAREVVKRNKVDVDEIEAYWIENEQVKFATRV